MHQHLAQHIPFAVSQPLSFPAAAAAIRPSSSSPSPSVPQDIVWAQQNAAAAAGLRLLQIARLGAELQSAAVAASVPSRDLVVAQQLRNAAAAAAAANNSATASVTSQQQQQLDTSRRSASSSSSSSSSSSKSSSAPAKTSSASGLDLLSLTATELPSLPLKKRAKRAMAEAAAAAAAATTSSQQDVHPLVRSVSTDSTTTIATSDTSVATTEEGGKGKVYIDKVGELDVLCGRGGRSNHHVGNKRYRQVVGDMKAMYRRTEAKAFKTDLSRSIVEHVCSYGGRFVKKDSKTGRYYVLSAVEARKKTSQALRESKQLKWTM